MTTKRSKAWVIVSTQEVREKVIFPLPVTMEEAEDMYMSQEYEDIIDSESLGTDEIISMKAF
jgi:hypothetical protein